MPAKPNGDKKKAKPSTPRTTARAPARTKATASQPQPVYYVSVTELSATVSDQRPTGSRAQGPFDGFEAARTAAVDVLVEVIEQAEQRLLALKRATSFDHWRSGQGAAAPS